MYQAISIFELRLLRISLKLGLAFSFKDEYALVSLTLSLSHKQIELATLARFFTQMEMCAVTWPSPLTICCPIIHKQPAGPANRPVALPVGTVTDGPSLKEGVSRGEEKSGG